METQDFNSLLDTLKVTIEKYERVLELEEVRKRSNDLLVSSEEYTEEFNSRMEASLEDLMDHTGIPAYMREELKVSEEGLITAFVIAPIVVGLLAVGMKKLFNYFKKAEEKRLAENTKELDSIIARLNKLLVSAPTEVSAGVIKKQKDINEACKGFLTLAGENKTSVKKAVKTISDFIDASVLNLNKVSERQLVEVEKLDREVIEAEADDYVVSLGKKDELVEKDIDFISYIVNNNLPAELVDVSPDSSIKILSKDQNGNKDYLDKKYRKEIYGLAEQKASKKKRKIVNFDIYNVSSDGCSFIGEEEYLGLPEKYNYRYIKTDGRLGTSKLTNGSFKLLKAKKVTVEVKKDLNLKMLVSDFLAKVEGFRKDLDRDKQYVEVMNKTISGLTETEDLIKQLTTKVTGVNNGLSALFILQTKNTLALIEYMRGTIDNRLALITGATEILESFSDDELEVSSESLLAAIAFGAAVLSTTAAGFYGVSKLFKKVDKKLRNIDSEIKEKLYKIKDGLQKLNLYEIIDKTDDKKIVKQLQAPCVLLNDGKLDHQLFIKMLTNLKSNKEIKPADKIKDEFEIVLENVLKTFNSDEYDMTDFNFESYKSSLGEFRKLGSNFKKGKVVLSSIETFSNDICTVFTVIKKDDYYYGYIEEVKIKQKPILTALTPGQLREVSGFLDDQTIWGISGTFSAAKQEANKKILTHYKEVTDKLKDNNTIDKEVVNSLLSFITAFSELHVRKLEDDTKNLNAIYDFVKK